MPLDENNFNQNQLEEDGRISPLPWRPWAGSGENQPTAFLSTPFVSPFASPLPTPQTSLRASPEQSEDEDFVSDKHKNKSNSTQKLKTKLLEPSGKLENCVIIGYDQERGRHLVAAEDLPGGQLLLSEPPFVGWLRPSRYLNNCFECHLPLLLQRFVPCRQCDSVRYCSANCCDRNWNQVHQFECKYLNVLGLLSIGHLSLRMLWVGGLSQALRFFDALSANNESISATHPSPPTESKTNISSKTKSHEKNTSKKEKTTQNKKPAENQRPPPPIKLNKEMVLLTYKDANPENLVPPLDQGEYTLVLHLATNFHHLKPQLAFNYAFGAVFLARLCHKAGLGGPAYRNVALLPLTLVLFHHILQVRCNAKASEAPAHLLPEKAEYEVASLEQIKEAAKVATKQQSINVKSNLLSVKQNLGCWKEAQLRAAINMIGESTGFGIQLFPRLSLVNHGCAANCFTKKTIQNAGSTVELLELRTAQPLRKGDQLLLNYGCAWQQMSVSDRREWLLGQYGFECKCLACKQGWQNWPQALRCDRCGIKGGAAVVMNSKAGLANCARCQCTLNKQELEQRLQQVDTLRRRIELLVQKDDQMRTPEQGSLLCGADKADQFSPKEKNEEEQKNFDQQLNKCLEQAEQLLFRDHDLLVDLHELAARSAERSGDQRRACRYWIAVFASSCLNQGQASYDVLLSVLELSRLLCSLAAHEHEHAGQCQLQSNAVVLQIERLENEIKMSTKPEAKPVNKSKSNRHSAKSKSGGKEAKAKQQQQKQHQFEQQLEQLNKRQNERQIAAESARKAANGYFEKALAIAKSLKQNEHQFCLSNANCVQRCVHLLTQLGPLFGNNV